MIPPKNITDFFVKLPGYLFVIMCIGSFWLMIAFIPIAIIGTIVELLS